MATFLSTCGQKEFDEKLNILRSLKLEWQWSQITTTDTLTNEKSKEPQVTPLQATEELKKFKPENSINLEPNEELEVDMDVKEAPKISVSNEDESNNSTKATIFNLMKGINIENVKSRKGRPVENVYGNFLREKNATAEQKRKRTPSKSPRKKK